MNEASDFPGIVIVVYYEDFMKLAFLTCGQYSFFATQRAAAFLSFKDRLSTRACNTITCAQMLFLHHFGIFLPPLCRTIAMCLGIFGPKFAAQSSAFFCVNRISSSSFFVAKRYLGGYFGAVLSRPFTFCLPCSW